jgi:hypothetical protein
MEAIIEDPGASVALRKHIVNRYPIALGKYALPSKQTQDVVAPLLAACDTPPMLQDPPHRRIRVYATDPSLSARFETAAINEVTLKVRWEQLDPGPIGKYLEIVDTDAAGQTYAPVNLNDSRLLAQDGWAPSEGNAQFHQQMTYAVAMKTIEYFELALGRPIFWQAQPDSNGKRKFVPQLKVVPHALHEANSYYSPVQSALLFGYFEAAADDPSDHVPGSRIYSCLSHDIIAHETTHAILDGMYRLFNTPTNPDVLAFHEAFADIVALMQHFTISQLLENEIVRAHGNLEAETILGSLAIQFGRSMGGRAALRDAIGWIENGTWHRFVPDPTALQRRLTPHTRGAVLVAAVFDAFIIIYKARTGDLLRIATNGTNDFPSGAFQTDLVRRLADEASKTAIHVLTMCIRALDYLPPVDITFFDYLRALITADLDLIDDDRFNYRIAFVEAFRRRGIYPHDMTRTFSVDTLRWQGFDQTWLIKGGNRAIIKKQFVGVIALLKQYAKACSYIKDRHKIFTTTEQYRKALSKQLTTAFANVPDFATELGLDPRQPFEVLELRRAIRINPDGYYISQVIVAVAQVINIDGGEDGKTDFLGGSTLVIDLVTAKVIYRIVKNINSQHRKDLTAAFVHEVAADPLRKLLLGLNHAEPFAALHAFDDDGV